MKLLHEHLSAIDDSIKQDNTTKAEIERHPALLEYLKTHTRLRRYMFQIRKCEAAPLDERLRQESIEVKIFIFSFLFLLPFLIGYFLFKHNSIQNNKVDVIKQSL